MNYIFDKKWEHFSHMVY